MNKKDKKMMKNVLFVCFAIFVVITTFFSGLLIGSSKVDKIESSCNSAENNEVDDNVDADKLNKVVGIYHTYNLRNREETIILNDDYTCEYLDYEFECTWSITGRDISLSYNIGYSTSGDCDKIMDDGYNITSGTHGASKTHCEEYLIGTKNCVCNPNYENVELIIVDNGILLDNVLFEKIG